MNFVESKENVLFVCVENAGRSIIAEAFFKKYAPSKYHAISAGIKPAEKINPVIGQVMKEVGINLAQQPKSLSNAMISNSFRTINMGCMDKESCPALFVEEISDWGIPDPKGKSLEEIRQIRDLIENKVKTLIESLEEG